MKIVIELNDVREMESLRVALNAQRERTVRWSEPLYAESIQRIKTIKKPKSKMTKLRQ